MMIVAMMKTKEEEEYDVTVGARMGKGMDTPLIKPTPNLKF